MGSTSIYSSGIVTITRAMFKVGSTQFPIRNITSVQILYENPNRGGPQFFIIVGAILAFLSAKSFFDGDGLRGELLVYVLLGGIALFVIGLLWWRSQKKTYYIEVETGGNISRAYSSTDHVEIIRINQAINTALEAH
jgi:hypothetical protein